MATENFAGSITEPHNDHQPITVVIPTYRREQPLLSTLAALQQQDSRPNQVVVVDQSEVHEDQTSTTLALLHDQGTIEWIRLNQPSIPHAMNVGLEHATEEIVLFLDDDIAPHKGLLRGHASAFHDPSVTLVAGRVVQPWHRRDSPSPASSNQAPETMSKRWATDFMGGNFSVRRSFAHAIGGFDENFVGAAYRFEADFARRLEARGGRILFVPEAVIEHLKAPSGGTRSFGSHLTTMKPNHAVGEYYYALKYKRIGPIFKRIPRSIATKHHRLRPWWIPATLLAEVWGLLWALRLVWRGPRYLNRIE